VSGAAASGALDPKDAQDLQHRIGEMTAALTGSGSGGGHGPKNGKGKGKGDGQKDPGGGAPDLTSKLDDFARRLADLHTSGGLSGSAYSSISSALGAVRSLSGSGSD
jgi:hypothetical protein